MDKIEVSNEPGRSCPATRHAHGNDNVAHTQATPATSKGCTRGMRLTLIGDFRMREVRVVVRGGAGDVKPGGQAVAHIPVRAVKDCWRPADDGGPT